LCRLVQQVEKRSFQTNLTWWSVKIAEFAELTNDQRILLRDERGFGGCLGSGSIGQGSTSQLGYWQQATQTTLEASARNALLPDEPAEPNMPPDLHQHWLPAVIALANVGVQTTATDLSALPLRIEFTPELLTHLKQAHT
jgi:hypothetical protein